jgi:Glyoxalase-like domain
VASIVPIADDQPDVPAHWGVTFAVDDADAVAKKASELGGTVVVPPFDAPWVRMTVLTDPQGATFVRASTCRRTGTFPARRTPPSEPRRSRPVPTVGAG